MLPTHKFSPIPELPQTLKTKKEKKSLHNLPKLDKSQLYFNSYHTQTPVTIKFSKVNTEASSNVKPYFMNNNLKRGTTKIKAGKDQNKSITNFLDITIYQAYNKDYKPQIEFNVQKKIDDKEMNLENKPIDPKISKPQIKHKNSCGNSLTLERNFMANDKNLRPSLYESASSKNKEFFHQTFYNRNSQKTEADEKKLEQNNELEVILTEVSENGMNEFPNSESKQAALPLFSREVLLGSSKNSGVNSNANKDLKASQEKKDKENEEGMCNFIVKNQDTGKIH